MAVRFNQIKTAIHSSGENGIKNAKSGMSVLTFGAASKETPLWKYGTLKSMTSARLLRGQRNKFDKNCNKQNCFLTWKRSAVQRTYQHYPQLNLQLFHSIGTARGTFC